jgi:hypothetical protein
MRCSSRGNITSGCLYGSALGGCGAVQGQAVDENKYFNISLTFFELAAVVAGCAVQGRLRRR